jgi:hypothetical protein
MADSTLRRPLITLGVIVMSLLVVLLSAFTLIQRGTFLTDKTGDAPASGWVAVGVRAPEGAGGVVTALAVGGPAFTVQPLRIDAATEALSINDAEGLSAAIATALRRPMAGAIIFDRLAFAGLVDAVDGINVSLVHALTVHRVDGSVDVFEPGQVTLDGIAASTYALSDPTGVRLHACINALVVELPTDHNRLTGLVKSLGAAMRATTSAATVVQWLEFWESRL